MGTRGNMCIQQSEGNIYVYRHVDGGRIGLNLRDALRKHPRVWRDEPYLARVIICAVIADLEESEPILGSPGGLHGDHFVGVSTYLTDWDVDLLVVDCAKERVGVSPIPFLGNGAVQRWVSFGGYAAMSDEEVREHHFPGGDLLALTRPSVP